MKTKKEIKHLLRQWESLKKMLDDDGDTVSRIVSKQCDFIISTLEWVLDLRC